MHEDLAQLDYMFCDKTGTLTQNELMFKSFKVLGPPAEQHKMTVPLANNDTPNEQALDVVRNSG